MINRVVLMGRIANDLEVKQTPSGNSVLAFTLAVQRNYARQGEERQTDFINCLAWRQQAEFIGKYFRKGRMIALEGTLRTRTYDDKNGTKHYVTEVFVDSVSFTGEKADTDNQQAINNYSNAHSQTQATVQQNNNNASHAKDDISFDDLADFDVISDDGVPF